MMQGASAAGAENGYMRKDGPAFPAASRVSPLPLEE
jgi:hypothetical protein